MNIIELKNFKELYTQVLETRCKVVDMEITITNSKEEKKVLGIRKEKYEKELYEAKANLDLPKVSNEELEMFKYVYKQELKDNELKINELKRIIEYRAKQEEETKKRNQKVNKEVNENIKKYKGRISTLKFGRGISTIGTYIAAGMVVLNSCEAVMQPSTGNIIVPSLALAGCIGTIIANGAFTNKIKELNTEIKEEQKRLIK